MSRAKIDRNENDQYVDNIEFADSCLAKVFENENKKVTLSSESDMFKNPNLP